MEHRIPLEPADPRQRRPPAGGERSPDLARGPAAPVARFVGLSERDSHEVISRALPNGGGESPTMLRGLARAIFRGFERLGVHVTPRHYAFPIPDTGRLDPQLWKGSSAPPPGIDLRERDQQELLASFA